MGDCGKEVSRPQIGRTGVLVLSNQHGLWRGYLRGVGAVCAGIILVDAAGLPKTGGMWGSSYAGADEGRRGGQLWDEEDSFSDILREASLAVSDRSERISMRGSNTKSVDVLGLSCTSTTE